MAGQYKSGVTTSAAADTAQVIETVGSGTKFTWGYFSLNSAASGPCRIGDSTVKNSTYIGVELNPGETIELSPVPNAMNGHFTEHLWVAFTGNAATDTLSWTLVKN